MSGRRPAPRRVTGPITGDHPPWGAPDADLAARGYVVEEYVARGHRPRLPPPRRPTPATVAGRSAVRRAPYRTRILVRPPGARRADFNGTVVVSWQNVSAGDESGAPPTVSSTRATRGSGSSAQEVGLYGFPAAAWSAWRARGVPLARTRPRALRRPAPPGRPGVVRHLHARPAARSVRSASTTTRRPAGRARGAAPDRHRWFAVGHAPGHVPERLPPRPRASSTASCSRCGRAARPRPEEGVLPMGVRTAIRTDTPTPVVVVNSEFETHAPRGAAVHRHRVPPDLGGRRGHRTASRAPPRRARRARTGRQPTQHRPGARRRAARAAPLARRRRRPRRPNRASRSTRADRCASRPTTLGNAVGGIRLPELAVPTATTGASRSAPAGSRCSARPPFTDDELRGSLREPRPCTSRVGTTQSTRWSLRRAAPRGRTRHARSRRGGPLARLTSLAPPRHVGGRMPAAGSQDEAEPEHQHPDSCECQPQTRRAGERQGRTGRGRRGSRPRARVVVDPPVPSP